MHQPGFRRIDAGVSALVATFISAAAGAFTRARRRHPDDKMSNDLRDAGALAKRDDEVSPWP
jgi:hypothetical protein